MVIIIIRKKKKKEKGKRRRNILEIFHSELKFVEEQKFEGKFSGKEFCSKFGFDEIFFICLFVVLVDY